ncbi:MAG: PilZ domain-containing protein, partial [Phormidesmis sp. CAN_BIN36]|nr:PilZ domain-containing protein [Phormidesmis sp. CAN_BIN36]
RSHRLERKLTATIYSEDLTLNGMTDNVSESGCQLIINSWSNLLDRVELELIGDYGARAFVTAEVIRAVPLNESQTMLSLEFVEPSRAQLDDLNRVIYSDVREWYSQQRDNVDDPMESFKFIASSVTRSLRKREAAVVNAKLRKPIHAYAQVYWQGHLYPAVATEMSHRSLQVEMETGVMDDRNALSRSQPVGLLLSQVVNEPLPKRLLAQVEAVKSVSDLRGNRLVLELAFPEKIMKRQGNNIKHLLKTLN